MDDLVVPSGAVYRDRYKNLTEHFKAHAREAAEDAFEKCCATVCCYCRRATSKEVAFQGSDAVWRHRDEDLDVEVLCARCAAGDLRDAWKEYPPFG